MGQGRRKVFWERARRRPFVDIRKPGYARSHIRAGQCRRKGSHAEAQSAEKLGERTSRGQEVTARKARLLLTERAVRDIRDIEAYSVAEWGKRTAAKYRTDVEALCTASRIPICCGRSRIFIPTFRCDRVREHLLVCDVQPKAIALLTVIHASGPRQLVVQFASCSPVIQA